MPSTRKTYGLADLLRLAADLIATFLAPLGVGQASPPVRMPDTAAPPAPAFEPKVAPAPEPTAFRDRLARAGEGAAPAAPEYVRRGQGKATRYLLASPGQPGPRFVRFIGSNGRAKYLPAGPHTAARTM